MAKATEVSNGGQFEMGKAYYCQECKRNHTKGKIYKEHLKYAKNITEKDEEVVLMDETLKEDNIEDDDHGVEDEDLDGPEFDLDFENDTDEMDQIEDEEEDIDIEDLDEDSLESSSDECVEAVKKLPGVGDATLKKLIKSGFNSLESIAYTPPSIIQEESGLGEKTVQKLVKSSMDKLNIGFKSAEDIWEHRRTIAKISTGSQELDDLLGWN